jgi:hypothetical protein
LKAINLEPVLLAKKKRKPSKEAKFRFGSIAELIRDDVLGPFLGG